MDLRLLSGDYDNEENDSQPVKAIIQDIEASESGSWNNVHLLLGVSGCGKVWIFYYSFFIIFSKLFLN